MNIDEIVRAPYTLRHVTLAAARSDVVRLWLLETAGNPRDAVVGLSHLRALLPAAPSIEFNLGE